MRGAKQGLSERLKLAGVLLNLRSEHVGEEVAAHVSHERAVLIKLLAAALGIALEIGLNPNQRGEVVDESTAATENVETGDRRLIGVNVNERKTYWHFDFGVFLRDCSHAKQEHDPKQQNQFILHCYISCVSSFRFFLPSPHLAPW